MRCPIDSHFAIVATLVHWLAFVIAASASVAVCTASNYLDIALALLSLVLTTHSDAMLWIDREKANKLFPCGFFYGRLIIRAAPSNVAVCCKRVDFSAKRFKISNATLYVSLSLTCSRILFFSARNVFSWLALRFNLRWKNHATSRFKNIILKICKSKKTAINLMFVWCSKRQTGTYSTGKINNGVE